MKLIVIGKKWEVIIALDPMIRDDGWGHFTSRFMSRQCLEALINGTRETSDMNNCMVPNQDERKDEEWTFVDTPFKKLLGRSEIPIATFPYEPYLCQVKTCDRDFEDSETGDEARDTSCFTTWNDADLRNACFFVYSHLMVQENLDCCS